jgi:cell division protein FtsX
MNVSSKTIIPSSAFRHITIMVFFMSLLGGFCMFGFIITGSVIKGWKTEANHRMTIDIPNFDDSKIIDQDVIDKQVKEIMNQLGNDPTVINVDTYKPKNDIGIEERFDITIPVFLNISLRPDRAENTNKRLSNLIKNISPQSIIRTAQDWDTDINETARLFTIVLGGLITAIIFVSLIMISGIVKSQLQASMNTITLIHLIGASGFDITRLFQNAMNIAVIKGTFISSVILMALVSPIIHITGYHGDLNLFWISIALIPIIFILSSMAVTFYTVFMALKAMP